MVINKNCLKERQTIQKTKILEYLCSVTSHPNAETIYNHVKKVIPSITLATVYRNLNLLAKNKKILKLEINNEFRFDGDLSHHQHCICKKCGRISDGFNKKINEYALKNLNNNFKIDQVQIYYYGTCKNCKK